MNRRPVLYIICVLLLIFVLAGCSKKEQVQQIVEVPEPVAEASVLSVEDADADVPIAEDDGYQTLIINEQVEALAEPERALEQFYRQNVNMRNKKSSE